MQIMTADSAEKLPSQGPYSPSFEVKPILFDSYVAQGVKQHPRRKYDGEEEV
jgi:hypothetical protein